MAIELKELVIRGFLGVKPKEEEENSKGNCASLKPNPQMAAQIEQLTKMVSEKNER